MIQPGTISQARTLAEKRFAELFPFDLDASTWDDLFARHRPGVILEAVKRMADTRDHRPDKIYARLLVLIEQHSPRTIQN
jgi:hypothetical protein